MSRRTLSNLGIHLDAVGRREGAFAPTEQAVEHYRRLAQTNPATYLPGLAMSLSNLGIQLDAVGRWKEALNEGEAVGLNAERDSERHRCVGVSLFAVTSARPGRRAPSEFGPAGKRVGQPTQPYPRRRR